jgi:hypothetical protein
MSNQIRVTVSDFVWAIYSALMLNERGTHRECIHISFQMTANHYGSDKRTSIGKRAHLLVSREYKDKPGTGRVFWATQELVSGRLMPDKWQKISDLHYTGFSDNIDETAENLKKTLLREIGFPEESVNIVTHWSNGFVMEKLRISVAGIRQASFLPELFTINFDESELNMPVTL